MAMLLVVFALGLLFGGLGVWLWGRRARTHEPEDRDAGLRRYQAYKSGPEGN